MMEPPGDSVTARIAPSAIWGPLLVTLLVKVTAVPACTMPDDTDSVTAASKFCNSTAPISTKGPMGRAKPRSSLAGCRCSCLDPRRRCSPSRAGGAG